MSKQGLVSQSSFFDLTSPDLTQRLEPHLKTLAPWMKRWLEQSPPPVLLLSGPKGVGKRAVSFLLAKWFLCENSGFIESTADLFALPKKESQASLESSFSPCNHCSSCRRMDQHHEPHFHWIEPQSEGEKTKSDKIKIDQFRSLKEKMGFSQDGSYRIIAISDADRLTLQAGNSLLKLLEEPPQGWIFLLTSINPASLMGTLTSRCQIVRLKPYSKNELEAGLQPWISDPVQLRVCSRFAQGSPERAMNLFQPEVWKFKDQFLDFLARPSESLSDILDWACESTFQFDLLLEIYEYTLVGFLKKSSGSCQSQDWPWEHAQSQLDKILQRVSLVFSSSKVCDFFENQIELLYETRQQSFAPTNRKILAQALLLPWMETAHD